MRTATKQLLWIKQVISKDAIFLFITTFLWYLCALFFNQNNKTLVGFLIIFVFILWKRFRNLQLALWCTYMISSVFYVGKTYTFELLSPGTIQSEYLKKGFLTQIVFSLGDICLFSMIILLLKDFYHKKLLIPVFTPYFYLLGINLLGILSAILVSRRPELSLIWAFQSCNLSILALYTINLSRRIKLWPLAISILAALTLFEFIVAGSQFFQKGYIGSSVESTGYISGGSSVDEVASLFRPLGTYPHPNILGQSVVFSLPILISFLYIKQYIFSPYFILFVTMGGIGSLLLSQSRSAWFSLGSTLLFLFYIVEKRWKLRLAIQLNKHIFVICAIFFLIAISVVHSRLQLLIYSFEESASGSTRLLLIKEWIQIIARNPLLGVGPGMSIVEGLDQNYTQTLLVFQSTVHNVYLLIASEQGVISAGLFILYIVSTTKLFFHLLQTKKKRNDKLHLIGVLFGSWGLYLNFLFQPHLDTMVLAILFQCILLKTNKKV